MRTSTIGLQCGFLLSLVGTSTSAQTSSQLPATDLFALSLEELREVRVSVASGIPERALDAASSVAVVTATEWNARGIRRSNDALAILPGVNVLPAWAGADAISIRGYTTELSAQGIATLIDGIPVNTLVYGSARYDKGELGLGTLDRIELIRGPGSTLYGSDAFHGVLSYQSFHGQQDGNSAQMEMASDNYTALMLQHSSALGDGRLSVAVDGRHQGEQDRQYFYSQPYTGSGERDFLYEAETLSVNYVFGDKSSGLWQLGIYGNQYDSEQMPGPGGQFFAGNQFTLDKDHLGTQSEFLLGHASYRRQLSDTVELSGRVASWKNEHNWNFDGERYGEFCAPGWTDPASQCLLGVPGHIANQYASEQHSSAHLELNLSLPAWQSQWTVAAGYQTAMVEDAYLQRISLEPEWPGSYDVARYKGVERDISYLLLQGRTRLFHDKLSVVYGARRDEYSDVGGHTSPRAGLVYQPTPAWAIKLLYGNAFKAPTVLQTEGAGTVVANPDLKPETIDTYELAVLGSHNAWQWELAVFQSEWSEGIALSVEPDLPVSSARYRNVAESSAEGAELVLNYLGEHLLIQSNATFVSSRNDSLRIDYVAFPDYLMNLGVGIPFSGGRHQLMTVLHYRGNQYESDYLSTPTGPAKPDRIDDYLRLDLQYSHQLNDAWTVSIGAYNLLDQDNVMPSLYNSEGGLVDRGQSVMMSLRWH